MKRALFLGAATAACLSLSACASVNSDPAAVLKALGDAYAHCERSVTYTASVGALNPASGAQISGTVHCPPKVDTDQPTPPPGGS